MARPTPEHEEEFQTLWNLINELSGQLAKNRALVQQLQSQSENAKGQAAHVGTGFPLRRFNLDISEEEFSSSLEAFAAHLVLENQNIQNENKQLNALLKEYETTMETVMGKFRGVAHASQQHDLSLHSYYTSLLHTLQTAHSSAHLHDNTSLSLLLTRLSTLLRSALRSMSGEDPELDQIIHQIPSLQLQLQLHPRGRANGSLSPTQSSGSGTGSGSGSGPSLPRAPPRPPPFGGSLPGAAGGYIGTEGQGDWALEREMEILRLEEENAALREMLGISQDIPAVPIPHPESSPEEEEEEDGEGPEKVPSRKGSLTVEELESGAAREQQEKERTGEGEGAGAGAGSPTLPGPVPGYSFVMGDMDTEGPTPGAGAGAGDAPREEVELADTGSPLPSSVDPGSGGNGRPVMNQSALGFQAGGSSESALDDSGD